VKPFPSDAIEPERNDMTITRIRRRRFTRPIEVAVVGFIMSLLALSLEKALVVRGARAFQPSLR
jgi:hypothetical protein